MASPYSSDLDEANSFCLKDEKQTFSKDICIYTSAAFVVSSIEILYAHAFSVAQNRINPQETLVSYACLISVIQYMCTYVFPIKYFCSFQFKVLFNERIDA